MDRESKHSSPVENAVAKNDTQLSKKLSTADRHEVDYINGALTRTATNNNVNVVQPLLDHVEKRGLKGPLCDVFSAAANVGRHEFMQFAAAINLCDGSVSSEALCWAAEHGHNDWIKPLLDNGAKVNSTHGRYRDTALHAAARNCQIVCLTTLIERWSRCWDATSLCNTAWSHRVRHCAPVTRR